MSERERYRLPAIDIVELLKEGSQMAVVYAIDETNGFFHTGRDLILTAQLGPGVVVDRRLKGVSVRVTR